MSDSSKLLIRKLVQAFIISFLATFLPFVMGAFQAPNFSFDKSAWIAALAGAFGAAVRAAIALGPFNIDPTDAQHSVIVPKTPTK